MCGTFLDVANPLIFRHNMMCASIDLGKRANIDSLIGFGWLLGKEISREEAAKAFGVDVV